ncbi:hydrolase 2, exosortase A system-associated [Massilia sp. IC2-477]|uniref:hydrolase 2, exosortase A system-associated n=1 Tax=unclassified Massilia TaxID=2609279 RepID=UPI001D0F7213|nr:MULTISPECIES: hydrolase 2, exosortase A system-associated [unclassified Massilia]MCC2955042.1 hydrolase 2, exosortase A system-associated [Massilia sp. IC2-477]MCC2973036.1 hydrolase 2, exosortase A system-associated [Massilia sp. IC2-476]
MMRPAPAEHFFLPAAAGRRYCVYHPAQGGARAALLYVPPFGEEMNRSRRAASVAARALAAQGCAVLQLDLHGSGDSDGEFGEARWDTWKADLALGHAWLAERTQCTPGLWGVRLGALLALDYARAAAVPVERFVLWQPVLRGAVYLNQLLRMRMASEMLAGEGGRDSRRLRESLRVEAQEIGGYMLAPALADAIEAADAGAFATPAAPLHWLEVVPAAGRPVPQPAQQQAWIWRAQGATVELQAVHDEACWSMAETAECPQLRAATLAALAAPATQGGQP